MGKLSFDDIRQLAIDKEVSLQWMMASLVEEELLAKLWRSPLKERIIVKNDYTSKEWENPLEEGIPGLELVVSGASWDEVIEKILEEEAAGTCFTDARGTEFIENRGLRSKNFLIKTDFDYTSMWIPLELTCYGEDEFESFYCSVYSMSCSNQVKEYTGIVEDWDIFAFRKMHIEGVFLDKVWSVALREELINSMKPYVDIVRILDSLCLEGRKIRSYMGSDGPICTNEVERLRKNEKNPNLIRRWKAYARTCGIKNMSFTQVIDKTLKAVQPVREAANAGMEFFGEWMPELGRYID